MRWSDLVRPEQTLQDMKGQETEASIFRNASIIDKKVVDNKITYGVAFGSQKHLPSRVMKNVIEIEQKQDGKVAYWFLENCIPLYLVKEYEEGSIQVNLPSATEYQNCLQSRRRQLKSYQREIFFYLTCRRDNMGLLSCSSCQLEVLIRSIIYTFPEFNLEPVPTCFIVNFLSCDLQECNKVQFLPRYLSSTSWIIFLQVITEIYFVMDNAEKLLKSMLEMFLLSYELVASLRLDLYR